MKVLEKVGCVVYFVIGIVQLGAVYAGLEEWLHFPWLLSALVGLAVAGMPIIGTVAGVMGAIKGWGWSLWAALALFGWPYILYVILLAGGGVVDFWARVFGHRQRGEESAERWNADVPCAPSTNHIRLRKSVYVWLATALYVGGAVLFGVGQALSSESLETDGNVGLSLTFMLGGLLMLLTATIILLTGLHKAWRAIQDGHARTTPAKAIWLLFVPLFNLYWVFQSVWGFAKDYNSYLERHQLGLRRIAAWPYLVLTLTFIASVVFRDDTLAVPASLLHVIFLPIVANSTCSAVNRLAEAGFTVDAAEPMNC